MNGHESPNAYLSQRLEGFRKADADRDAFVSDLFEQYRLLSSRFEEICSDFNNEQESRRMWQLKAGTSDRALAELRQSADSNPFVLVILDGDGAIFRDDLYAQGKDGGSEAAHRLQTEIKNQLKDLHPDANTSDWNIVVQLVLNLEGLSKKLHSCGLIVHPNELPAFGRAFGLTQVLFNFLDVGSGKERADHKIRETLRMYLPIAQCKHIFFGPCNDNGYLPFLEPYKRDASIANRITLVETRPAEPGFIDLNFKRVSFPHIFRQDNLPSGRPVQATFPAPSAVPIRSAPPPSNLISPPPGLPAQIPKPASPAPSSENTPPATNGTSWASLGKGGSKTISIAPKKTAPKTYILLNAYDQRLDQELPRMDPAAEKRFLDRMRTYGKCCNEYHLNGRCPSAEYCDYWHGERLSPGEQLVLKWKARGRCCPGRGDCRDFVCTYGHVCRFADNCRLEHCWFSDTHHTDTEPAKKFYEDGSEDWIQAYLDRDRS